MVKTLFDQMKNHSSSLEKLEFYPLYVWGVLQYCPNLRKTAVLRRSFSGFLRKIFTKLAGIPTMKNLRFHPFSFTPLSSESSRNNFSDSLRFCKNKSYKFINAFIGIITEFGYCN